MNRMIYLTSSFIEFTSGKRSTKAIPMGPTYLSPDSRYADSEISVGGVPIWVPPLPSSASRLPALRSRGSCRGFIVGPQTNRAYVFESILEYDFLCILLTDQRVKDVYDQPPPVSYIDIDGRIRRHTFDAMVVLTTGTRIAFAVKPRKKVESTRINETIRLIAAQNDARFADHYRIVTEDHITRAMAHNSRLFLRARRARNKSDINAVRNIVPGTATVSVANLVAASGIGARGLTAVISLIDEGFLKVADRNANISEDSLVSVSPHH